jgi:2-keto-4-pentenoate hydratase
VKRSEIDDAATFLASARLEGEIVTSLKPKKRPPNAMQSYLIQDQVHEILQEQGRGRVIGYKIGCTTPVMQKFLGINNPCAGGMLESGFHRDKGIFARSSFRRVGVECEIAVRIACPIGFGNPKSGIDEIADCVAEVLPAIEVVDDRYDNYELLGAPTLIADDFFHSGCVVGTASSSWKDIDLSSVKGSMQINGEVVGSGVGGDIMEHPFWALAWLAKLFEDRGKVIEPGQFVLLGSVVETKWVEQGDVVHVSLDQLGNAEAQFN